MPDAIAFIGGLQLGWSALFVLLRLTGAPADDAGLIALVATAMPTVTRLLFTRTFVGLVGATSWRWRAGWRWYLSLLIWATVASLFIRLPALAGWALVAATVLGLGLETALLIREGRWSLNSLGLDLPLGAGLAAGASADPRTASAAVGVLLAATLLLLARLELAAESGNRAGPLAEES